MAANSIDGGKLLAAGTALDNAGRLIQELTEDLEKDLFGLAKDDRWLLDGFTAEAVDNARYALADLIELRERLHGGLMPGEIELRDAVDYRARVEDA